MCGLWSGCNSKSNECEISQRSWTDPHTRNTFPPRSRFTILLPLDTRSLGMHYSRWRQFIDAYPQSQPYQSFAAIRQKPLALAVSTSKLSTSLPPKR
jgi:hypothetical protein